MRSLDSNLQQHYNCLWLLHVHRELPPNGCAKLPLEISDSLKLRRLKLRRLVGGTEATRGRVGMFQAAVRGNAKT